MSNETAAGGPAASPPFEGPPVEGKPKPRWHPETLWCSLFGHSAPAGDVRSISEADSLIALALHDGAHMSRCLRCDMWLLTDESTAAGAALPSLVEIEVPQRGKALRDAIVLKFIAIERGVHCVVFTIVFVGILLLESHLGGLKDTARHLVTNAQSTISGTGQATSRDYINKQLNRFIDLKPGSLRVLLFTAAIYAVVEGTESVGLWMQRRWAEYLTALATAGFLPIEIDELVKRVTVIRLGALIINLAVLFYLIWAKRLFGVRGGTDVDSHLVRTADQIQPLPGQVPKDSPAV